MTEPTTAGAAAFAAAASGLTMALLGVDAHSLLWGLVGAFVALGQQAPSTRMRAAAGVVLSTLVGAVLGNAAVSLFGASGKLAILAGCIVGGAGAQAIVPALIRAATSRIDSFGAKQ